jgi:hypothetical protein
LSIGWTVVLTESVLVRPRKDSNLRTRFRKPMLYPLSYGGSRGIPSAQHASIVHHGRGVPTAAPDRGHDAASSQLVVRKRVRLPTPTGRDHPPSPSQAMWRCRRFGPAHDGGSAILGETTGSRHRHVWIYDRGVHELSNSLERRTSAEGVGSGESDTFPDACPGGRWAAAARPSSACSRSALSRGPRQGQQGVQGCAPRQRVGDRQHSASRLRHAGAQRGSTGHPRRSCRRVTGRLVQVTGESVLVEAFGRAMVSIASEDERRAGLGTAARARARETSWARSLDRWGKVLLEVSSRSNPQAPVKSGQPSVSPRGTKRKL